MTNYLLFNLAKQSQNQSATEESGGRERGIRYMERYSKRFQSRPHAHSSSHPHSHSHPCEDAKGTQAMTLLIKTALCSFAAAQSSNEHYFGG